MLAPEQLWPVWHFWVGKSKISSLAKIMKFFKDRNSPWLFFKRIWTKLPVGSSVWINSRNACSKFFSGSVLSSMIFWESVLKRAVGVVTGDFVGEGVRVKVGEGEALGGSFCKKTQKPAPIKASTKIDGRAIKSIFLISIGVSSAMAGLAGILGWKIN